jgi:uncharacterized membrane protein
MIGQFHPPFAAIPWSSIPFHPIFVNFTAALIPTSLLFDLLGAWRRSDTLRAAAWYTLLVAAFVTPLTAAAGWLWLHSMEMGHWQMPIHKWLGTAAAALVVCFAVWRGWLHHTDRRPGWPYALAGLLVLGALIVQGELGSSRSFDRGIVITSEHHGE